MRLAQRRAGRTGKDVLPLGAPDSLWNIPLGEWHEQKHLALVAGYCARVERVLDVALHHPRPHFIATPFRPNSVDSPDDGLTLDRWMADLLGRTRTGSINAEALSSLEEFLASFRLTVRSILDLRPTRAAITGDVLSDFHFATIPSRSSSQAFANNPDPFLSR